MEGTYRSRPRGGQRGFTYLWVIAVVAVLAIGLLAVSEVWVTTARRQKLVELDWVGTQFTQAIVSYYYASPTGIAAYPTSLQDLLHDPRYNTTRRHLREVYRNPFTGSADWELVTTPDGHICGVRTHVRSESGIASMEFVFHP